MVNRHVDETKCYWSFIAVHHRCVERVVRDNILGFSWFGQHKGRRSSQQGKELCTCVSCLSSDCSFRMLVIRFDLIAFLRRVLYWSARDPFYFPGWFLLFKCLGERFCQPSPRPCRNVRFPRFARGGVAVNVDLCFEGHTGVAGSTRQNGG